MPALQDNVIFVGYDVCDVISAAILDPPSWISQFLKSQKITEIDVKSSQFSVKMHGFCHFDEEKGKLTSAESFSITEQTTFQIPKKPQGGLDATPP